MRTLPKEQMIPAVIVALLVAVLAYYILNAPDRRDPGEKIGDAINELHNGVEDAARQLEDRTPGDKLQDAISDEKEDLKKALNQQ
jgi:hypothetical protein